MTDVLGRVTDMALDAGGLTVTVDFSSQEDYEKAMRLWEDTERAIAVALSDEGCALDVERLARSLGPHPQDPTLRRERAEGIAAKYQALADTDNGHRPDTMSEPGTSG